MGLCKSPSEPENKGFEPVKKDVEILAEKKGKPEDCPQDAKKRSEGLTVSFLIHSLSTGYKQVIVD